jgi:bifunctional DNA-binding transcriptional regulator/antitoxin component of YhaV-PrlF toxin-antitoxin module
MPQLVKGGKYAFGWSRVGEQGRVVIPPEAVEEYHLKESEKLIVMPGSRTSGGFGLAPPESLSRSPLRAVLDDCSARGIFQKPAGEIIQRKGKAYCWVELRDGGVSIPPAALAKYGIRIGDRLLVIRGSGLAVGFAVRGPIVAEAEKHRELKVFE